MAFAILFGDRPEPEVNNWTVLFASVSAAMTLNRVEPNQTTVALVRIN